MDIKNRNAAVRARLSRGNRQLAEALKHVRRASGEFDQLDLFLGILGIGWEEVNKSPEVRAEIVACERYFAALKNEVTHES